MNDSQEENKEKLRQFERQLKNLSFPSSPISIELASYVAGALEQYLNNETKSLDVAFGLNPKRGAKPLRRSFWLQRARIILVERQAGKSWIEITSEQGGKNGLPTDERGIRRISEEYNATVMAEQITINDLLD